MSEKCEIFLDMTGSVARFVCEGLKEDNQWIGTNITLGIKLKNQLIAGVIINDIRPKIDCWLTIFSINKRWCSKRIIRAIFDIAFDFLKCRRVSAMVDVKNTKSLKLLEGLGFLKEGLLRGFQNNGNDALVFSMLKNECQWRTKENE